MCCSNACNREGRCRRKTPRSVARGLRGMHKAKLACHKPIDRFNKLARCIENGSCGQEDPLNSVRLFRFSWHAGGQEATVVVRPCTRKCRSSVLLRDKTRLSLRLGNRKVNHCLL